LSGQADTQARCALATRTEIHLYLVNDAAVGAETLSALGRSVVSPEEHRRVERFHSARDRRQALVTRALLRTVLSRYHPAIRPSDWSFEVNAYGRPAIASGIDAPLCFNLSHSHGMIALLVAHDIEIGVDIEWRDRAVDVMDLADQVFAPVERSDLQSLSPSHQKDRFFDLWTLKEAYIKARGMGLSIHLSDIALRFGENGRLATAFAQSLGDVPSRWRFWGLSSASGFSLAVAASAGLGSNIRMFEGVLDGRWIERPANILWHYRAS
jgi:4'-phosphopantetheinyl transferase